jgi:copper(I)-binding protein
LRHVIAATILFGALAGCQRTGDTQVEGAWVRLAAAPGRPAGGYFMLKGGPTDRTLTGVTTSAAGRVELHETMAMGHAGGMTMKPVGQVALPAGATVTFAPGGKHLMLFDVAPGVKSGDRIKLSFAFADGGQLTADARVIAAGDAPPVP